MKRSLRKFLMFFALVLVFASLMTATPTMAKTKIKINRTGATLIKGKTLQLKITGTKKKITWKSSNKSVATVTGKGKVTAKKAGKATISAKVKGGKTYKCKVTVKNPAVNYKANVKISYSIYKQGLIATVTNKNKTAVDVRIDLRMYKGSYSNSGHMDNLCLGAGKTCVLFTEFLDANNEYLQPNSYKITSLTVKKSEYVDYSSKISLSDFQMTDEELRFKSLNSSGKKLELTKPNVVFVYYDANGNIINCFDVILNCSYPDVNKSAEFALLPIEYTSTGKIVTKPDHYKYYINCAFGS